MRRDDNSQLETAGQDSFLDVTTNIVGVLIILVMIVGLRTKNAPTTETPADAPSQTELSGLERQATAIEYDVRRLDQESKTVEQEIAARSKEREVLATIIAATEKEIGDARATLDSTLQEDYDLRRQIAERKAGIDREQAELNNLDAQLPQVQEVKHYPTPISRKVLGHELHFQLLAGRIAYVPIDEFIDDVRSDMRRAGMDVAGIGEKVNIVGPRDGFEFRYTLDVMMDRGRGVVGLRTREWQLVPVGMQQGEPVERALAQQSEFRNALARHSPRETSVTVWTYPDSFESYRQVKDELHRLGYATAGRPLPKGVLIGGSDRGTKSSAQ